MMSNFILPSPLIPMMIAATLAAISSDFSLFLNLFHMAMVNKRKQTSPWLNANLLYGKAIGKQEIAHYK